MIIAGYIIVVIGLLLMYWGYLDSRPTDKNIAAKIAKCFSDVDFSAQTFSNNGVFLRSASGEKLFYSKTEIDKGIKCLDDLVSDLRQITK